MTLMEGDDAPQFLRMNRRRLLAEDLTRNAINFPLRPALHDVPTGRRWTFSEFDARVSAAANVLRGHFAVAPGDRIAVLGRNHADTVTLYYAGSRIGAVIVPLNFNANTEEQRYILDDSTPVLFAVSAELAPAIDPLLFEGRRRVIFGADTFDDELCTLIAAADPTAPDLDIADYDPAFIMYTGGTTGRPKGVVLGQANYVSLAQNMLLALAPQRIGRADSWLMCAPLYHSGGWAYSVTTLYAGMCLHLLRQFDAPTVTDAIMAGHGSVTWLVPTMSRRLVDHARATALPESALDVMRLIVSAGAALDLSLRHEMGALFRHATILDMVGQTEVTSTTMALSETQDIALKPNAVGVPVPGMAVALLDDDNRPVGPGGIGEICYRGSQLMLGYWNRPDLTREAMGGGWFHSGDLGSRDEAGAIFLVGRKKDVIKSGGETVIPNEIEAVIQEFEGVLDACVIGLKDNDWGERVHAVVACKTPDPDQFIAALRAHCRSRLSGYKVPKTWTLTPTLPVTPVGKVDKAAVKRLAEP